jgi:hypothetical protein
MRSAVVAGSYCSETLLSSSLKIELIGQLAKTISPSISTYIPDLEFDRFSIELDRSDFEVNSNGADIALGVCVISESQQETRLSDSRVANQK